MESKKKPGMTLKNMDEMGKVAAAVAGKFVSDSARKAMDSGKTLGMRGAKEAVGVERKMFKSVLDVFDMVHAKAGKTMEKALSETNNVPAEARQVAHEWSRVVKVGRAELKTAIEKSFDLVEQYLDRVSNPVQAESPKPAAKVKPAAKKASAKKPAAKKPAAKKPVAKKPATDKPAAQKKPAAKKKPAAGS